MNSAATQFQKASQTLDSVFLALGLASNLFVCFIMIRCKLTKKSISNFYVFQLSVAEVVYRTALAVLEIYFLNRNNHHLISDAECKVIIFWRQAFCAAVFILLVGIATDRKEHIINSIKAMTMNKHRKTRIAFIWLFALILSIPMSLSATLSPRLKMLGRQNIYEKPLFVCLLPRGRLSSMISVIIYFFFAFFVPLAIISRSYYQIFIYLRDRAKTRKLSAFYIRSKYKALSMLVIITASFLLSWGPLMCSTLATAYDFKVRTGDISVMKIAISISLTSSFIHPFIYSFGNANFRSEVVRTFRSCISKARFQ